MKLLRILLILFFVFCPTSIYSRDYSFNEQPNIVFHLPDDIPQFNKWPGYNLNVFDSPKFKLIIWIGKDPNNISDRISVLHAVEGEIKGQAGKDWFFYVIAINYFNASYIDKSYFETGIPSGNFEKTEGIAWPSLDPVIEMKTEGPIHLNI